jgi:hypothetical protein
MPNPGYDPTAKPTRQPKKNNKKKRIDPTMLFKRRDTNNDGFVTLKEYIGNPKGRNVPALTRQFKQRDTNNDSRLTLDEMKKR